MNKKIQAGLLTVVIIVVLLIVLVGFAALALVTHGLSLVVLSVGMVVWCLYLIALTIVESNKW